MQRREKIMSKKTILLFGILCALASVGAFANNTEVSEVEQVEATDSIANVPHDDWAFLGCVHSVQDCSHEASHHGYHHSSATYDQYACPDHHHPVACYGVN
jgi:hypothetical protein